MKGVAFYFVEYHSEFIISGGREHGIKSDASKTIFYENVGKSP
ncbi:hypothetical protein JOC83_002540 [Bacillus iocasae]|uniref:Uncharacterized protein n=1 Tax=Priestia iocasae TaxID=2291674 RepID=A0ABS2QW28_9BACI|nr:hypothetical protein [Metabacillus iocasae]